MTTLPQPESPARGALDEAGRELRDAQQRRERAEARLRHSRNLLELAVETAQIGIWTHDGVREDIEVNARWLALHGLDAPPRQLSELYAGVEEAYRDAITAGLDEVFSGAKGEWTAEYRTTGGRWIVSRMRRMDGADAGIVHATATDVTAQKQALDELEERVALQELLVGVASHDLKTPLMTLQTALDLLPQLGELTEGQKKATQRGHRAVDRAKRLVMDLLDVTRHRLHGHIPLTAASLDLAPVVAEAVAAAQQNAGDDVRIDVQIAGEVRFVADRARVQQVLANLLDNAVSHADRGEVRVVAQRDGDEVTLSVYNGGEPLEASMLPHVFEPFQRGRQERAARKNLGLGLHIVKLLVEQHGGQVSVTADATGTTFTTRWRASGPAAPSTDAASPAAR